jgi:glycine/D-amino acid oxidase-like deaminating enzyme
MAGILDMTWRTLPTLAPYYFFPDDENGVTQYRALRGPEYLRALRALVLDHGVEILDQSPASELLRRDDGSIAGACGWRRQRHCPWDVRAGAVVIATGGYAFKLRLLGGQTNTGDGHLMAAEAGAELSGLEFSNFYSIAPAWTTMTRTMSYAFARFFDADGLPSTYPPDPTIRAMSPARYCAARSLPTRSDAFAHPRNALANFAQRHADLRSPRRESI